MTIRALVPQVSRNQAIQFFAPGGLVGRVRTLYAGPLLAVAQVYIPFRVFRTEVGNNANPQVRFLAVDSVNGSLDLYGFDDTVPGTISLDTRNALESRLDESSARQALAQKLRRMIFLRGFFRIRQLSLQFRPVAELHIPYWVGFRGQKRYVSICVIDGLRRQVEGPKVRDLVRSWLAAEDRTRASADDAVQGLACDQPGAFAKISL
jgi:hypothetical protein